MNFLDSFISALKPRFDDDVVDRLNYYYTTLIILVLAITISAKQYVGQPIQCWVPAQFTGAWEQYAENYCFVQNTYWIHLMEGIPNDFNQREKREIGYYQWVPFIMAIEALLFYIPCVLWRLLNWQSGINVQSAATMAADTQNINDENKIKAVKIVARHIENALELQREIGTSGRRLAMIGWIQNCGKTKGAYVTTLYLFVKVLYVVNAISQFFLLNAFLGTSYKFWGAEILADLSRGVEWQDSGHFPRVTMCDFEVRVLGNLHRYTIQCVLMINMFNEKVFLFLWWWFLIVAVATIGSLFYWVMESLSFSRRKDFIAQFLKATGSLTSSSVDHKALNRFINVNLRYKPSLLGTPRSFGGMLLCVIIISSFEMVLKNYISLLVFKIITTPCILDGVMVLRIIACNAGDLIATYIVHELWTSYRSRVPVPGYPSSGMKPLPNPLTGSGPEDLKTSMEKQLLMQQQQQEEEFVERLYLPLPPNPPSPLDKTLPRT